MKQSRESLGQYLQAARERKELSLRAIEKATGISNAYLSQLESGKIQQPSPVILHKLSEVYDTPYSEVMALAGYPVPDTSDQKYSDRQFESRIGPLSKQEEDSLIEYLDFIRARRSKGKRS